jgi:hypothetical protein
MLGAADLTCIMNASAWPPLGPNDQCDVECGEGFACQSFFRSKCLTRTGNKFNSISFEPSSFRAGLFTFVRKLFPAFYAPTRPYIGIRGASKSSYRFRQPSDELASTMAYTSRQSLIIGIHWSLFILATAVLSARFYVRTRIRPRTLGWDDW